MKVEIKEEEDEAEELYEDPLQIADVSPGEDTDELGRSFLFIFNPIFR